MKYIKGIIGMIIVAAVSGFIIGAINGIFFQIDSAIVAAVAGSAAFVLLDRENAKKINKRK